MRSPLAMVIVAFLCSVVVIIVACGTPLMALADYFWLWHQDGRRPGILLYLEQLVEDWKQFLHDIVRIVAGR